PRRAPRRVRPPPRSQRRRQVDLAGDLRHDHPPERGTDRHLRRLPPRGRPRGAAAPDRPPVAPDLSLRPPDGVRKPALLRAAVFPPGPGPRGRLRAAFGAPAGARPRPRADVLARHAAAAGYRPGPRSE